MHYTSGNDEVVIIYGGKAGYYGPPRLEQSFKVLFYSFRFESNSNPMIPRMKKGASNKKAVSIKCMLK